MDGDRFIEISVWILSLILSIVFFYNGAGIILGFPVQVAQFKAINLSLEFAPLIGGIECIGALMLTVPRFAIMGGGILGLISLASAGLHFWHQDISSALRALVIALMIVAICYLRLKGRRHAVR